MGRKRRKKHYSRKEREALRARAESGWQGDNRGRPTPHRPRPRPPRDREGNTVQPRESRSDAGRLDTAVHEWGSQFDGHRRRRFRELVAAVLERRPGLLDRPYRVGLAAAVWAPWLDRAGTWRPAGKGLDAAFRSLIAHLLGRYPIAPPLWDMLFRGSPAPTDTLARLLPSDQKPPALFVAHLARGESPRRLVGTSVLPTPLTRRMLHLLVDPPRSLPYIQAIRRAQVLGYGGCESLARTLAGTRLDAFQNDEAYWAEAIHWICRQPDLEPADVGPIVDLLAARERTARVSLKGRTARSVLRLVRQWHDELAQLRNFRLQQFLPSGFAGATWVTRRRVHGKPLPEERWAFREILTARDLVAEGAAMSHCVASYRETIADGDTSIWSLRRDGGRRLTIEVRNRTRRVVQVRGKANRLPRLPEIAFLDRWARKNGLAIVSWEVWRARRGE